MAIVTRASAKAYFETGDKPTQAQFIDLIDGAMFNEDFSTFGKALVSAATTAAGVLMLGAGTVGAKVFDAATTASAQNNIGGGTVGKTLFESIVTASAQTQLGGGTVGRELFSATTTASAVSQLALAGTIPTTAAQSNQETGTSGATYVSPSVQQFHPSAAKAWAYITYSAGTPAATASYNVSSVTDTGTGSPTPNYTTALSSADYAVVAVVQENNTYICRVAGTATGSNTLQITTTLDVAVDAKISMAVYGDL